MSNYNKNKGKLIQKLCHLFVEQYRVKDKYLEYPLDPDWEQKLEEFALMFDQTQDSIHIPSICL